MIAFVYLFHSDDRPDNNKDSLERNIDAPLIQDGNETPTISPSSTLSYKDHIMPGIVPGVISGEELELMELARDMVQRVFYSTRENVNFVHEILRQVREWTLFTIKMIIVCELLIRCLSMSHQTQH